MSTAPRPRVQLEPAAAKAREAGAARRRAEVAGARRAAHSRERWARQAAWWAPPAAAAAGVLTQAVPRARRAQREALALAPSVTSRAMQTRSVLPNSIAKLA